MPETSLKTRRVLSINGQEYIVADSVKSELLMQLLDLFSNELLKPVKEEYLCVARAGGEYGYDYVLVERGAEVRPAGLAVSRREVLTAEAYREREAAGKKARVARAEAAKAAEERATTQSQHGEAAKYAR